MADTLKRHLWAAALGTALASGSPLLAQQSSANIAWSDYPGWRMIINSLNDAVFGAGPYTQDKAEELYLRGVADMLAISNIGLIELIAENPRMPDTVILFPTSISVGADKIVLAEGVDPANLIGRRVGLVRNSVSHYMYEHATKYSRSALQGPANLTFLKEDEIVDAFRSGRVDVAIGREPVISGAVRMKGAQVVYDSSGLNNAVVDLVVMRRDVYEQSVEIARRFVQSWFEKFAETADGRVSVSDAFELPGIGERYFIEGQGISRRGFATIDRARAMMESGRLRFSLLRAKDFVDLHTSRQPGIASLGAYGIQFADGSILGNPLNVRVQVRTDHFDDAPSDG
ncbi:hypothetical protein C8N43_1752 [Litoreibacter ponti]|uniref:ABC-type nitrate/sulfonate/bicarbonate transport system substrate-binding protein n=1 Tax=Litoreibacter ponti TaxID=1510457 RepID=A0A2T6BLZ9_9RHOB|nr:hypothetical protein [Litoreibacter ponti]PTX57086.1 hypothetical protein C8N43_1752 [Litoreibacter ponti]